MRPDLVIFDCDGVLVDSERIANRVFAECLTDAGYPVTADECWKRYKGGKFTRIKTQIEQEIGRSLGPGWIHLMYERQFDAFRTDLVAIDHVSDTIDRIIAADIAICVGSNGPPLKMEVTLGITGLGARFNGNIFSADHVANPKPAPDLFLHAAEQMGVARENALVIEDSATGVRAAAAAGIPVFGFAEDADPAVLKEAGASEVFSSMKELPGMLGL